MWFSSLGVVIVIRDSAVRESHIPYQPAVVSVFCRGDQMPLCTLTTAGVPQSSSVIFCAYCCQNTWQHNPCLYNFWYFNIWMLWPRVWRMRFSKYRFTSVYCHNIVFGSAKNS